MSVTHIVIFQLKPESTPEYVASVIRDMMALEQKCVKPDTKKPYIVSLKGGKQMSIEQTYSIEGALSFIVEFASVADRDYYVNEDGAHHAFVGSLLAADMVARVQVCDFVAGEF